MPHDDLSDPVLVRWREEARRALPSTDHDVVEEVAVHLALRWQAAVASGASPETADRAAQHDLAAWRSLRSRRPSLLTSLTAGWSLDARLAWRIMLRQPAHAAGVAVLTCIAVAAVVAAAALTYGLFWRPLPYPSGERLAVIWQVRQGALGQLSLPDFRDVSGAAIFESASAVSGGRGSLRVGDRIERVNLLAVDPAGLSMLGARPQIGRLLDAGDAGRLHVLISDRLWRTHLGASPEVLGSTLWLSGQTYTVVGVLMPGFDFELPVAGLFFRERHDLWTLLSPADPMGTRRDVTSFEGLVRLRSNVTLTEAQAAVDTIGSQLADAQAATNRDRTFRVVPLHHEVVDRVRQPLLLGGLAAVLTLGIAVANLVMLVGVRLSARLPELAVRQALGAGALRVRRALMTEHALLVALGAAGGVTLARWGVVALIDNEAAHLPRPEAIRFDTPVMLAAALVALLLVAALSFLPLQATASHAALRSGSRVSRGHRRVRRVLIAGQLALAVALATGSTLLGLSLLRLRNLDPGFQTDGVVAIRMSAYPGEYSEQAHVEGFVSAALEAVRRLPGVAHVGAGSGFPLSGQTTGTSVLARGQSMAPGARMSAGWEFVTVGYVEALGMVVRSGRSFIEADRWRDGHVTVVNEALARTLFPGEDAVGKLIAVGGGDGEGDWHEIVGVVADVRYHALATPPLPRVYDLFGQHWGRTLFAVARAQTGTPPPTLTSIRRVLTAINPEVPTFEGASLEDLTARSAAPYRLSATVAAGLAFTGLLLALVGVYAMAAVSVADRRREVGVRAALGASPADLVRLVLDDAASTVALGGALGTACALGVARLLQSRVFGVETSDVAMVVPAMAALLVAAGVAASLPSAARAAATDPIIVIRGE